MKVTRTMPGLMLFGALACSGIPSTPPTPSPSPATSPGAASSAPAEAAKETAHAVILGGGSSRADADRQLLLLNGQVPFRAEFPKVVDSSSIEGLKPGFWVILAALPRDQAVADEIVRRSPDGAYERPVRVAEAETLLAADVASWSDDWGEVGLVGWVAASGRCHLDLFEVGRLRSVGRLLDRPGPCPTEWSYSSSSPKVLVRTGSTATVIDLEAGTVNDLPALPAHAVDRVDTITLEDGEPVGFTSATESDESDGGEAMVCTRWAYRGSSWSNRGTFHAWYGEGAEAPFCLWPSDSSRQTGALVDPQRLSRELSPELSPLDEPPAGIPPSNAATGWFAFTAVGHPFAVQVQVLGPSMTGYSPVVRLGEGGVPQKTLQAAAPGGIVSPWLVQEEQRLVLCGEVFDTATGDRVPGPTFSGCAAPWSG